MCDTNCTRPSHHQSEKPFHLSIASLSILSRAAVHRRKLAFKKKQQKQQRSKWFKIVSEDSEERKQEELRNAQERKRIAAERLAKQAEIARREEEEEMNGGEGASAQEGFGGQKLVLATLCLLQFNIVVCVPLSAPKIIIFWLVLWEVGRAAYFLR